VCDNTTAVLNFYLGNAIVTNSASNNALLLCALVAKFYTSKIKVFRQSACAAAKLVQVFVQDCERKFAAPNDFPTLKRDSPIVNNNNNNNSNNNNRHNYRNTSSGKKSLN
jgi:hypothetical protein